VAVIDDDGLCLEVSDAACAALGRPRDAMVGKPFAAALAGTAEERLTHLWRALGGRGGHAGPFETAAGAMVDLTLTRDVAPGRHVVAIAAAGSTLATRRRFAPAGTPGPAPAGRTPSAREREVLDLLAQGRTDPQIAELLGLSPATVQTHVRNAKSKLGARTRSHAVAIAIGRGLIEPRQA
jgi:DNA-binding CsgD family transcriptional regulator